MSPMVNSVNVTEACAKALIVIASSPTPLDQFDPRVPRTLVKNELAEIDEARGLLRITEKGREFVKASAAKGGGSTPKSAQRGKKARKVAKPSRSIPPKPKRKKDSPPPHRSSGLLHALRPARSDHQAVRRRPGSRRSADRDRQRGDRVTARELALIREAFRAGMTAEHKRTSPERSRWDMEELFSFGLKVGEERGRGLAKRKPLKERR